MGFLQNFNRKLEAWIGIGNDDFFKRAIRFDLCVMSDGVDATCGGGSDGLGLLLFSTVVASRCCGGVDAHCDGGSGSLGGFCWLCR